MSRASPPSSTPPSSAALATSAPTWRPKRSRSSSRSRSPVDHLVEAGLEQPDLGAVVDRHRCVEVAVLDLGQRLTQVRDRLAAGLGGDEGRQPAHPQRDRAEHDHGDRELRRRGLPRVDQRDRRRRGRCRGPRRRCRGPRRTSRAVAHAGHEATVRDTLAEDLARHRPQGALGQQVGEARRGPAGEQRRSWKTAKAEVPRVAALNEAGTPRRRRPTASPGTGRSGAARPARRAARPRSLGSSPGRSMLDDGVQDLPGVQVPRVPTTRTNSRRSARFSSSRRTARARMSGIGTTKSASTHDDGDADGVGPGQPETEGGAHLPRGRRGARNQSGGSLRCRDSARDPAQEAARGLVTLRR